MINDPTPVETKKWFLLIYVESLETGFSLPTVIINTIARFLLQSPTSSVIWSYDGVVYNCRLESPYETKSYIPTGCSEMPIYKDMLVATKVIYKNPSNLPELKIGMSLDEALSILPKTICPEIKQAIDSTCCLTLVIDKDKNILAFYKGFNK